jgi:single-strand DNA-binding protein
MSFSHNRAQIIGNLTRDPEIRQTPNGNTVASIGVATNHRWLNKQTNEWQEEAEFHNVVAWGRIAENCQQYLKKGQKVFFEGRLKTSTWDDPDGKKNYKTEIIVENMIMLGSSGQGAPMSATPTSAYDQTISNNSQPAQQHIQSTPTAQATESAPETNNVENEKKPAAEAGTENEEEKVKIDNLPF